LKSRTFLEIGCGTGLVSIIAASPYISAKRVFATDIIHRSRNRSISRVTASGKNDADGVVGGLGWDVLKVCEENVRVNGVEGVVKVRELNVEHEDGALFRSFGQQPNVRQRERPKQQNQRNDGQEEGGNDGEMDKFSGGSFSGGGKEEGGLEDELDMMMEDSDEFHDDNNKTGSSLVALPSLSEKEASYAWSLEDLEEFHNDCDIILGADIIYIDKVTFHLVKKLWNLLKRRRWFAFGPKPPPPPTTIESSQDASLDPTTNETKCDPLEARITSSATAPKPSSETSSKNPSASQNSEALPSPPPYSRTMYLSIEKRIQFTPFTFSWNDRNIRAPAWDFFVETVEAFNADRAEREGLEMVLERVETNGLAERFLAGDDDDDDDDDEEEEEEEKKKKEQGDERNGKSMKGVKGTGVARSTRVKELEIWRVYLRATY
jgi:hypothetical protein